MELPGGGGTFLLAPRGLASPATTAALLGCLANSWDRLREAAADALAALPCPPPGMDDAAGVGTALAWAAGLVESPRPREADAGGSDVWGGGASVGVLRPRNIASIVFTHLAPLPPP